MYNKALEEALINSKKEFDDIGRKKTEKEIDKIVRYT